MSIKVTVGNTTYKVTGYFENDEGDKTYLPSTMPEETSDKVKSLIHTLIYSHRINASSQFSLFNTTSDIDAKGVNRENNLLQNHDFKLLDCVGEAFISQNLQTPLRLTENPALKSALKAQHVWDALENELRHSCTSSSGELFTSHASSFSSPHAIGRHSSTLPQQDPRISEEDLDDDETPLNPPGRQQPNFNSQDASFPRVVSSPLSSVPSDSLSTQASVNLSNPQAFEVIDSSSTKTEHLSPETPVARPSMNTSYASIYKPYYCPFTSIEYDLKKLKIDPSEPNWIKRIPDRQMYRIFDDALKVRPFFGQTRGEVCKYLKQKFPNVLLGNTYQALRELYYKKVKTLKTEIPQETQRLANELLEEYYTEGHCLTCTLPPSAYTFMGQEFPLKDDLLRIYSDMTAQVPGLADSSWDVAPDYFIQALSSWLDTF